MMRNLLFVAGLTMLPMGACDLAETENGSNDTGVTRPEPTSCTTSYTGPVLVAEATVACEGTDTVRYLVRTDGWTSDGLVNAMETANASPWDDEHDIVSYEYDACGLYDNLETTLSTGADLTTWVSSSTTVFTCADHFDDANGVMTYSARVYDLDRNFADCLAWGHDPEGWRDGAYDGTCVNCPTAPAEIASCVPARRAR